MKIRLSILYWIIIISLLVLLHVLNSCSPAKKLQRLYKNHPYLFEDSVFTDTLIHKDTIQVDVPGSSKDTSAHISVFSDTVVIVDSIFTARIFHDTITDTFYINVDVPIRRMYIPYEVQIPCDQKFYKRPRDALMWSWINDISWYHFLFMSMIIVLVIHLVRMIK